jgi:hypothetical protein
MKDMEILREGDIPYFEELEKEGKAVILRLDLETLLNLDLNTLYNASDSGQIPTDEQVKAWLTANKAIVEKHVAQAAVTKAMPEAEQQEHPEQTETGIKNLLEAVINAKLNQEDQEIIEKAIEHRFSAENLLLLLDKITDK